MMKVRFQLLAILALTLLLGNSALAQDVYGSAATGEPLWGQSRENLRLGEEAAIARYNYCPTGGCVIRLETIELRPRQARRGQDIAMTTTYTILTPEKVAVPVTVTREIFYRGKSLGKTKSIDTRNSNGTWSHQINFVMPRESAPGIYTLVTKVTTGYGSDLKSVDFMLE